MPSPASVYLCVEMKGHPLSREFRWHQLPLRNLQDIPVGQDWESPQACRRENEGDKSSYGCGGSGIPVDGGLCRGGQQGNSTWRDGGALQMGTEL